MILLISKDPSGYSRYISVLTRSEEVALSGKIDAICISSEKGIVKTPVEMAELRIDHGIVGDAHAGDWHRQVSLLAMESIAKIKAILPDLADGAFAENIVTSGLEIKNLPVGTRLQIGASVLELTQIGKECHYGCAIREATGDCVMPREGVFCRVLEGGTIRPGDSFSIKSEEIE